MGVDDRGIDAVTASIANELTRLHSASSFAAVSLLLLDRPRLEWVPVPQEGGPGTMTIAQDGMGEFLRVEDIPGVWPSPWVAHEVPVPDEETGKRLAELLSHVTQVFLRMEAECDKD